mmetsp:Transcript_105610/g.340368  ORF Transcript_105610/g.340368 Transcript_105610/m.340368 type:complete len:254 (+) Transcript_105610:85-846(+)
MRLHALHSLTSFDGRAMSASKVYEQLLRSILTGRGQRLRRAYTAIHPARAGGLDGVHEGADAEAECGVRQGVGGAAQMLGERHGVQQSILYEIGRKGTIREPHQWRGCKKPSHKPGLGVATGRGRATSRQNCKAKRPREQEVSEGEAVLRVQLEPVHGHHNQDQASVEDPPPGSGSSDPVGQDVVETSREHPSCKLRQAERRERIQHTERLGIARQLPPLPEGATASNWPPWRRQPRARTASDTLGSSWTARG